MTQITGWIASGVAFLVVLVVGTGLFGGMFGLLGAFGAWYYVWKYFGDKYKVELDAVLNPPAEVWELRMEDAWLCLEDVLDTVHMQTGISGISRWRIVSKDNNRGVLQAQIDFKQALGSPTDPKIFPRTVTLDAQLSPEADSTRVEIKYSIFSPSGDGMVKECIKTTQGSLKNRVAIAKGA